MYHSPQPSGEKAKTICPDPQTQSEAGGPYGDDSEAASELGGGKTLCTTCGVYLDFGDYPFCPHGSIFNLNAQRFSAIVIHKDADGNVRLPAHSDAPVPEGFQKFTLTDFHQVRKFERDMNLVERVRMQEHKMNKVRNLEGQIKTNREVMDRLSQRFTPRGRRFYEAMRAAGDRRLQMFKDRNVGEPNFHVDSLSMNSSNREEYRDQRNDWGKQGSGRK